jgi:hypothetical protein
MRDESARTSPGGGGHVEPWLDAYRTGELEAPERVRIERHLARCPDCAARLTELESFHRLVGRGYAARAARASAQEPDWDRQRREILARTTEPRPEGGRHAMLVRFTPQAALAALVLLVLVVLVREGIRRPEDLRSALEGRKEIGREVDESPSSPLVEKKAPSAPVPEAKPAGSQDALARLEAPAGGSEGAAAGPGTRLDDRGRAPGRPAGKAAAVAPMELAEARQAQKEDRAATPAGPETEAQRGNAAAGEEAGFRAEDLEARAPAAEADRMAPPPADERRAEGRLAAAEGAVAMDELQRLELYARKALASGDSLETARALGFWRDSVAARMDLDPARKRAAASLVDSLARGAPAGRRMVE